MSKAFEFLTGTEAPYTSTVYMSPSGNVGIGTQSPGYRLHVVGEVFATNDITLSSDATLKHDLAPITDAGAKVGALTGYTFVRHQQQRRQAGVIAQDVRAVLPEAVSEDPGSGLLSVSYGAGLVALLVEAVKELTTRVAALESQLAGSKAAGGWGGGHGAPQEHHPVQGPRS